ncbi:UNVERIFIED_CONTAM: hypothetical protein NCL1_32954 [Trichonephila clavipes]
MIGTSAHARQRSMVTLLVLSGNELLITFMESIDFANATRTPSGCQGKRKFFPVPREKKD